MKKPTSENSNKLYAMLETAGVRYHRYYGIHKEDIEKAAPVIAEFIAAGPEMVLPTEFDLDEPVANMAAYRDLKKRKEISRQKVGKYDLVEYSRHVALLDESEKEVKYLIQYITEMFFGKSGVTQIKLWRSTDTLLQGIKIRGKKLTAYVFFDILLHKNDCIVTDKLQTDLGVRFWKERIDNALNYNFPVYYLDLIRKTKIRINSMSELKDLQDKYDIWSESSEGKHRRIAICKDDFWKKGK